MPPVKPFPFRPSAHSRDYGADASAVGSNSSGGVANSNSSPQWSVQRDLLPNGGFDVPDEGLPSRPFSYSSPRRFAQQDLPPGDIPDEGYRRSSTSPWPSSHDIGILQQDGIPRYRLSTSRTSNGGDGMPDEGLHAPRISNNRVGFQERMSAFRLSSPDEGLPSFQRSSTASRMSVVDLGNQGESQPSFRADNSGASTGKGSSGVPDVGMPADRGSSSPPRSANDGEGMPASGLGNSSDRISTVRLAAQRWGNSSDLPAAIETSSTSGMPSTFALDIEELSNDMRELDTEMKGLASEMKELASEMKGVPVMGAPPVSASPPSRSFTSRSSRGKRALESPYVGATSSVSGISPVNPVRATVRATSGANAGLPRMMLPAEQVGQRVPCPDADCLTHQCCVKVVCICDPDGHPHPIGVEPANSWEQAPSSRGYLHEPLAYKQEGRLGNRSAYDPLPVRLNDDPGSTSSGSNRRKLRPITPTTIQVSFSSKVSTSSLRCQPESGADPMREYCLPLLGKDAYSF